MPGSALLVLSILRHSEVQYDRLGKQSVATKKADLERRWQQSFNDLPDQARARFDYETRYKPWAFNDVVGYLEIEVPWGKDLRGWVCLIRRCFPRTHSEHDWPKPQQSLEVLGFRDVKAPLHGATNSAFVDATRQLASQTRLIVRREGCGTRYAVVKFPEPGLEHIDFVGALAEK